MSSQFDFSTCPIIAHRGASAYAPENTMAAFDLALAKGCQWVEFDVALSSDQEPFIFHDDTLNRTTNGKGLLCETPAAVLQSLDAGSWFSSQYAGEKLLHFREMLQWLVFSGMQANIEIKATAEQAEVSAVTVLSHLQRYWPSELPLPLVSSFEGEVLAVCRSLVPELPLGYLMHTWRDDWLDEATALSCTSVHVSHRVLTAERVQLIKEAGFLVLSYTIDRSRLAKKLLSWGVDAVFSNYPDLLA